MRTRNHIIAVVSLCALTGCLFKKSTSTVSSPAPAKLTAEFSSTTVSEAAPADFSTVESGSSATLSITIKNTGESAATDISASGLEAPFAFTGGSFPGTDGTCTNELAAGATCTLSVTYSPSVTVYTTASANDQLIVSYDNGSADTQLTIDMKGTGDNCSTQESVTSLANETGSSSLAWENPITTLGQSFQAAEAMRISSVKVKMYQGSNATVETVVMRLRADDGSSKPATSDLGTATVSGSAIGTSMTDVEFQFAAPVSLTAGSRYWLILDPGTNGVTNGDLTTYLYVKGSFSDVWSGGSVVIGVDGSDSWNAWSYDLLFSTKKCGASGS